MTRHLNYNATARVFNGTAPDAISNERFASWKIPGGGYIHELQLGKWGDFYYRITGKDNNGKLLFKGGWKNNRPAPINKKPWFLENIFEKLNALDARIYDKKNKLLYPLEDINLQKALLTINSLTDLIHIKRNAV